MKIYRLFPWLTVMSLLVACLPQSGVVETTILPVVSEAATTSVPPPTLQSTATALPPDATVLPALSEEPLKNATLFVPVYQRVVTLVDGQYEAPGELWVRLLPWMAFGDLNGDGLEDAAILLAESGGGSGTFVSLVAVINQNGQPLQSGTVTIDDRPAISGVEITAGKIEVTGLIHSMSDPFCCPTLSVSQNYILDGEQLVLIRQTTTTPSGATRVIIIESPLSGSQTGAAVQVQGNMPIAPFENNLLYRVYDLSFNVLDAGPFGVNASEPGGPGQFDNLVSSPAFTPGSSVWFELSELSPADGTALVIERIRLTVR